MRFKILCGMISLDANQKIKVENAANIFTKNINNVFAKNFGKSFLKEMNLKKVEIYFSSGFEEDSYLSAIVSGFLASLIQSFYAFLSWEYDKVELHRDINPIFDNSKFEVSFNVLIEINIIGVMIAFFKAIAETKKFKEKKSER